MDKGIFLSAWLLAVVPAMAQAQALTLTQASTQAQRGYVKTRGRLAKDGSVIAGTRLSGATVTVRGGNNVVSGANGAFSLQVPSNKFYLQNVRKNDYVLCDPDVLKKQYDYSSNDLILVMEEKQQQARDLCQARDDIRGNLYAQYQRQAKKLKALLEEKKIREEEYIRQKNHLDSLQDSNEQLIAQMATRYAQIDYDQLDEFTLKVKQLIYNGELTRADSLLKTRGNLRADVEDFHRFQQLNDAKRMEQQRRDSLQKQRMNELAQRCYSQFEVFKGMHNVDSARVYIELRASVDTTNVEWQIDAGDFLGYYVDVQFPYHLISVEQIAVDPVLCYYRRAISMATLQYGENNDYLAECYCRMASRINDVHYDSFELSREYFQKALDAATRLHGEESTEVAACYVAMGNTYKDPMAPLGQWNRLALESFEKALAIRLAVFGEESLEVAECYEGLGAVYGVDDITAADYYNKALAIMKPLLGENSPEIGFLYIDYAVNYIAAEEQVRKVAAQCLMVANQYEGHDWEYFAEDTYKELNEYLEKALAYYEKALPILRSVYDDTYPAVISLVYDIESTKQDIENNLEYAKQAALEIQAK